MAAVANTEGDADPGAVASTGLSPVSKLVLVGAGLSTLVWLGAAGYFLFHHSTSNGGSMVECFYGLDCLTTANEWGDFLAGSFSPLAFIWLVVAVFLQSMELKEQRVELAENRSVAKAQAEYIGTQTSLLMAQEQRYVADDTEAEFEAAIELLAATLINYDHIWSFATKDKKHKLQFRLSRYTDSTNRRIVIATGQELRKGIRVLREQNNLMNPQVRFQMKFRYDFARTFRVVVEAVKAYNKLKGRSRSLASALEVKTIMRNMEILVNSTDGLPAAFTDLGIKYRSAKKLAPWVLSRPQTSAPSPSQGSVPSPPQTSVPSLPQNQGAP